MKYPLNISVAYLTWIPTVSFPRLREWKECSIHAVPAPLPVSVRCTGKYRGIDNADRRLAYHGLAVGRPAQRIARIPRLDHNNLMAVAQVMISKFLSIFCVCPSPKATASKPSSRRIWKYWAMASDALLIKRPVLFNNVRCYLADDKYGENGL